MAKYIFEVEFDPNVWDNLSLGARMLWVQDVENAINDEARVTGVKYEG